VSSPWYINLFSQTQSPEIIFNPVSPDVGILSQPGQSNKAKFQFFDLMPENSLTQIKLALECVCSSTNVLVYAVDQTSAFHT